VDISRIGPVEKRDAVLPAAEKRQPDMPEFVFAGFGMSIAGEIRGGLGAHLSKVVRCVIQETVQGDIVDRSHLLGHLVADRVDVLDLVHLVPEVGRFERVPVECPVFADSCSLEPGSQGGLALGFDRPVEDDEMKILADAHALVAFRYDPIDDVDEADLLLQALDGRHRTKLERLDLGDLGSLEAFFDLLGGAEIFLPDDAGLSLDTSGFGQIIVGTTAYPLLEDISHARKLS
jgi:hypothetical protein